MLRAIAQGGAGSFGTLTVTGQGLFADGSTGVPSISFASAPTDGFSHSAGAGSLDVSLGGNMVYRFSAAGGSTLIANNSSFGLGTSGLADIFIQRDAAGLAGIRNSIAVRGGAGFGMQAISGSYSVQTGDFTICCSTATQGFTVLLPLNPAMNQYLNIKKVSADANRLIIDGNGNLIDALSTQSTILTTRPNFAMQFGSTVASPTGSAWQIL